MIEQSLAREILDAAMAGGADYAELFLEDSESTVIELTNASISKANYTRLCGAGIRVLRGDRSAYASTGDPTRERMLDAARAASAALREKGTGVEIRAFQERQFATAQQIPFSTVDNARRVALLHDAEKATRAAEPELTQVVTRYLDKLQRVWVFTSDGLAAHDERPRTRGMVQAVASKDGVAQLGFEGPGCCRGFEAYGSTIDLAAAGVTAAHTAVTMLHAGECPAGRMPVIINGGFGGAIFHEACGHSLEATCVARGNSEFSGRLGEKIAADCVNAVDDGTMTGEWGSINMDDEGMPPQRNQLIENGVLKGYLIDKLGARRMKMATTGSSRRQSYQFAPTSRMTNTFICPGSDDDEEMIRTMGDGLFASKIGGGSVNPATGEFNFAVNEGYWVKDGRIDRPVRGATLIGRGAEVLRSIDRVGGHMWMGQGMCGSLSGYVPTNVGQPRIRISCMTVGGKGGAV